MYKTKLQHYVIVIVIAIAFMALMRSRAIQQIPELVDGSANKYIQQDEIHFMNLQQLTFSGENAEAYFSPDSKKLIFQSHDGEGLCDQIYIMNIESGKSEMVSTGDGVTTCAYFQYPNNEKIVYASTHHKNKACPPPPDFSRGYVWKLYEGMTFFARIPMGATWSKSPMKRATMRKALWPRMAAELCIHLSFLEI